MFSATVSSFPGGGLEASIDEVSSVFSDSILSFFSIILGCVGCE